VKRQPATGLLDVGISIFVRYSAATRIPEVYSDAVEGLLWLLLEAGVALALLLLIVWWTWPRRKAGKKTNDERD
jgi:hypothetical protein